MRREIEERDMLRHLLVRTVLAMAGTEPQRQAFIEGYNGFVAPKSSSRQMLAAHELGGRVSAAVRP